ncbi:hypothetical protein JH26_14510 [Microvirga sp. BSC39]|nr:hypothetical protein JH26_14510 [Microvirga sp. BSC39]
MQSGVDALLHDVGGMVFQRLADPPADAGFRFARQVGQGSFRIPDLVVDRNFSRVADGRQRRSVRIGTGGGRRGVRVIIIGGNLGGGVTLRHAL